MRALLLDTHVAIWSVSGDRKLSRAASDAIVAAESARTPLLISTISIVEASYPVERSRIQAAALDAILKVVDDPEYCCDLFPVNRQVATAIVRVPRDLIPDMPDRILAATALSLGIPLVTRDEKIRAFDAIETIW